ncbi:MAG: glycine/sarcosine/betaine reductase selenoprotein B family protein [Pseudomonadota bacterium]
MAKEKQVDGFRFLPPGLAAWFRTFIPDEDFKDKIPWTPMPGPLNKTRFSLVCSAGISLKSDHPFDMEREKKQATWGDRSYRIIPKRTKQTDIDVNHLHINTSYIKQDINVMLPLNRMEELEKKGMIGSLAPSSYSFYGFQWETRDFIDTAIAPMADKMKAENVQAVLMIPA